MKVTTSDCSSDIDLSRLPRTVLPSHYDLRLEVDLDNGTFTGDVDIEVDVLETTETIWLNSTRCSVSKASFSNLAGDRLTPTEVCELRSEGCLGVSFATELRKGCGKLSVSFAGTISKNHEGFYHVPYTDSGGTKRNGAATLFAATEARSCFPCFDEPDMKSTFAVQITLTDSRVTVISNMPGSSVTEGDKVTWTFDRTPKMSTYLLCFVIGQYDFVEGRSAKGIPVRIYTPCGKESQGKFALEVAVKCLDYFDEYFGIPYVLPKLDLVAVSRLSVGGMENWGLITCREAALLEDSVHTAPVERQGIATLVSHEISHQWFGNLVTMEWWSDLWLSEGFATFMQYKSISDLYPELEVMTQYRLDVLIPALRLDSMQHSHPIEVPLKNASEIPQVFDKITYNKGSAILVMLEDFVGSEAFSVGIRHYIKEYQYKNATTNDLWRCLSATGCHKIEQVMKEWTQTVGFPMIRMWHSMHESTGNTVFHLRQIRFGAGQDGNKNTVWSIPLKYVYSIDGEQKEEVSVLFDERDLDIVIDRGGMNNKKFWIKLNAGWTGFYRVNYTEPILKRLLQADEQLSPIDQVSLFNDQVALIWGETGSTIRLLRMVASMRDRTNFIIWKDILSFLGMLRCIEWSSEDATQRFNRFMVDMVRPCAERLGFLPGPDDSHLDTRLRSMILISLGVRGDETTTRTARELFRGHIDGSGPQIPPSLRDAVYKIVMSNGDRQTCDQLLTLYKGTDLAEERNRILSALGYSRDPNVLARVLEFALSEEVLPQSSLLVICSVCANRLGFRLAWNFFVTHCDKFVERYAGGLFLLHRLIRAVTESLYDEDSLQEMETFFADHPELAKGCERTIQQAKENIKLNILWKSTDLDIVTDFLDKWCSGKAENAMRPAVDRMSR